MAFDCTRKGKSNRKVMKTWQKLRQLPINQSTSTINFHYFFSSTMKIQKIFQLKSFYNYRIYLMTFIKFIVQSCNNITIISPLSTRLNSTYATRQNLIFFLQIHLKMKLKWIKKKKNENENADTIITLCYGKYKININENCIYFIFYFIIIAITLQIILHCGEKSIK